MISCVPANIAMAKTEYTYTDISLTGTFMQTEARSMLATINEFRTTGNMWYWNEDDTTKTYLNSEGNTYLAGLTYDYNLEQIAMQRAAEIAVDFAHDRPAGTSFNGYTYGGTTSYGENILYHTSYTYYGFSSSMEMAFDQWREEDESYSGQGHRRNMLYTDFTCVGIGAFYYDGMYCWVQEFGYTNSDAAQTTANDSQTTVPVTIRDDKITVSSSSLSADSLTIYTSNPTATVPSLTINFSLAETPKPPLTTTIETPDWSSSDESVFTVSGSTITAVWDGSDNATSASANLVLNRYGNTYTVPVTILTHDHEWDSGVVYTEPTYDTTGIMRYTCSVCGETRDEVIPTLTDQAADFVSARVALGSTIGLQFLVDLDDTVVDSDDYMSVAVGTDTPYTISVADTTQTSTTVSGSDVTVNVFEVPLTVKQMATDVTVTMYVDGHASTPVTYSVREYGNTVLASDSYTDNEKDVIKSMLALGGYAQVAFDGVTDTTLLADSEFHGTSNDPVLYGSGSIYSGYYWVLDWKNMKGDGTIGDNVGIKFKSLALILDSATRYRMYLDISDGFTIDDFMFPSTTCSISGISTEYVDAHNMIQGYDSDLGLYYIEIQDVTASELKETFGVRIYDADGNKLLEYAVSPSNYIYNMYMAIKTETSSPWLMLVKALAQYANAVETYNSGS